MNTIEDEPYSVDFNETIRVIKTNLIEVALLKNAGNVTRAARTLKLQRNTLQAMIKSMEINNVWRIKK